MEAEERPLDPDNLPDDLPESIRSFIRKGGNLHLVSNHRLDVSSVTPIPEEGDVISMRLYFHPNNEYYESGVPFTCLLSVTGAETLAWDLLKKVKEAEETT